MTIRKQVAYDPLQYRQAEPHLRRWRNIGLQILRLTVLALILAAWFWLADWVFVEEHRRMPWRVIPPTPRERLESFLPYSILLPVLLWVWYRARIAARKRWLERMAAAGIQAVEFTPDGISYWSDRARYFSRWDTFSRIVDCPRVLVLFVDAASAILMPKIDMTELETAQILDWHRTFLPPDSPLEPTPDSAPADFTLNIQPDRRDIEEAGKMRLRNSAKTPFLVARWARISISAMIFLGFVAFGIYLMKKGSRGVFLYWTMFGVPVFILVIYLWSYSWVLLVRRLNWRLLRTTLGKTQLLRFSPNGAQVQTPTTDTHYDWPALNNVLVGKRTVLLAVIGGGSLTIPRRQIPAHESDFIDYLRQHVHNQTGGFPVQMPLPPPANPLP